MDEGSETAVRGESVDPSTRSRELVSMASHDLRTPLGTLRLNVQLLKRRWLHEAPSSLALAQGLDRLAWITERALAMVDDMLVANVAPKLPFKPTIDSTDLETAIQDSILLQKELLERARCDVRVSQEGTADRVIGPWRRGPLLRLFLNLLDNVRRHAPGSPVTITLSVQDRWARVLFCDAGPGIPVGPDDPDDGLPRAAGHHGGHGLGLWIVHKIVADLGGEVATQSRPGVGLTFDIRLPLG